MANLEKPSPYLSASFPSKLTFDYMTPLLWRGFRRPLEQEDLWQLEPEHSSEELGPVFQANLFPEGAGTKKSSLFPALVYSYGFHFFLGTAAKVFADILSLVAPQSE